jgi:uncharacterized membrane protein YqjE
MGNNSEPSIGDLVAQAIGDVTKLVKFEIDLAKKELRGDVRRVGLAVVLTGMAAFAGCLVMVLLSFALVYGLIRLGIVPWAAFLIVSGFLILLAALAILIVYVRVRGISGLRKTRESVQEDLALLRRDDEAPAAPAVEAG